MASHCVRLMPEVAAFSRDSTSGCEVFVRERDVMKKPPRRNWSRSRQNGSCAWRDGLPQEPSSRAGRRSKAGGNGDIVDDDKENACGVSRCRAAARSDSCTSRRPVSSPSPLSPSRPTRKLVYQQCLDSVIASYLSPLRDNTVAGSLRHRGRFFDTLTSPGEAASVTKPYCDDQRYDDGGCGDDDNHGDNNNNNNDDDDTNTSVWLSNSTLPAADDTSSSGVETATSSQPEARPAGDDVIKEQEVPDGSRSVALCDVSRISAVSSTSVAREQLSSLGAGVDLPAGVDGGGGPLSAAFHSTFNYPLHSTLRGTSVRCPSPLPESPASPVRRHEPKVCRGTGDRHPRSDRQRDLPPPACRRCVGDSTPLRRQHGRARLERQRPTVDRRRRSAERPDVDDEVLSLSTSISLQATRGSLPDLSDLSTDSEIYEQHVERRSHCRQQRKCGPNPPVDVDVEARLRRHRGRTSCTHCRCQPTQPYVRRSAVPLTIFDAQRKDQVHLAWSRTSSSADRPFHRRCTPAVSAQPSLQRPTGCLPGIRSHGNDAAVVMETRRRRHRQGVQLGCGHKRLLSKKLKLFSNILCSARAADVTQLTTLGHV